MANMTASRDGRSGHGSTVRSSENNSLSLQKQPTKNASLSVTRMTTNEQSV